jgi:hypothetical protein
MSGYGLRNMLVEFFRYISLTKGSSWTAYNYAVEYYRLMLATIWEGVEGQPGQPVPIMFEKKIDLESWASSAGHKLEVFTSSRGKEPNSYLFFGNPKAQDWYAGTEFLWVKASWQGYRKAFKKWLEKNRSSQSVAQLHEAAIYCYEDAIKLIREGKLLQAQSPRVTSNLIGLIDKQIQSHKLHVNCSVTAPTGADLLKLFDYTLDGDHVVNKASLKGLDDAWVLMAPVHADANRGFGSRIERAKPQYQSGTGVLTLSPIIAFKLFASVMPVNASELEKALDIVSRKIGPRNELDDALLQMRKELSVFIQ